MGDLYGTGPSIRFWPRCHACDKLLAEALSPPFRIRCKCRAITQAGMEGVTIPAQPERYAGGQGRRR